MRGLSILTTCLSGLLLAVGGAAAAGATNHTSQSPFVPPPVFRHANLVRNLNLEKSYARDTVNIVIENIDKTAQDFYYFPAVAEGPTGNFEARDKKQEAKTPLKVERNGDYYRIQLASALKPKEQVTLSISYALLGTFSPLPAKIDQTDKQYIRHSFSAVLPSPYESLKQKTKIKLFSADIPDYTVLKGKYSSENKEDPEKQGTSLSYGPFGKVPANSFEPAYVRFEATRPINYVRRLERDVEVSHWGGNLATEERYLYESRGAGLKNHFDRVAWAASSYYKPPTSALKEFIIPLRKGTTNPYFVDDVGNVSTSNWRPKGAAAPLLELRPRYPVFGDWKYKFKIGYDIDLKTSLRKAATGGDTYVLKVPFLEGPKQAEGVAYEQVKLRVILPEGASNVQFDSNGIAIVSHSTSIYKSYMDTIGRTALTLEAVNLVDDVRGQEIIVTYDYPFVAGLRKPLTFVAGAFALLGAAWLLSKVDVSISQKK